MAVTRLLTIVSRRKYSHSKAIEFFYKFGVFNVVDILKIVGSGLDGSQKIHFFVLFVMVNYPNLFYLSKDMSEIRIILKSLNFFCFVKIFFFFWIKNDAINTKNTHFFFKNLIFLVFPATFFQTCSTGRLIE